jgi:hypothetical protein
MGLFQRITQNDLRLGCLLGALTLYAFWGSPTPDRPGIVEILVGVLLICAIGIKDAYAAVKFYRQSPIWRSFAQLLLLFGLSVPIVIGTLHGHETVMMLRDLISFLFLLLPLFLLPLLEKNLPYYRFVLIAALCIGVIFAARSLMQTFAIFLPHVTAELIYLENMPTVLFAALFLIGGAGENFLHRFHTKSLLLLTGGIILAGFLFLPMVLTLQRASIGYGVIYITVLLVLALCRFPYRVFWLLVPFAIGGIFFAGMLGSLVDALASKTEVSGFNMRFEEMAAAWRTVAGNPLTLVFGNGWGAAFESPAVAGIEVNFTHSLLTSALLKTGLLGLGLVILYLLGLGRILWPVLLQKPVLALALAGPILIDTFLYASFKSLDFGLILLLAAASPLYAKVASGR